MTFQVQRTPLHFAAVGGVRDIAELLLKNGADPNNKNEASVRMYCVEWIHLYRLDDHTFCMYNIFLILLFGLC